MNIHSPEVKKALPSKKIEARNSILQWALLAALLALISACGFFQIFSHFSGYDDEGYMLSLLRESSLGGVLYEDFYSQYGPAYHWIWNSIFQSFGLSYTHDNGRLATLVCWVASSFITGISTWKITKNFIAGLSSTVVAFSLLRVLVNEPMHPLGLLSVLLSLLCFSTTIKSNSLLRSCIISGAIVAMGALKINFGVLGVLAIATYSIQRHPMLAGKAFDKLNSGLLNWHFNPKKSISAAIILLTLPLILTASHPKTALYGTLSALLVVLSENATRNRTQTSNTKALLISLILCIIIVIAKAYQVGITPLSLIQSVIARPLSQPEIFAFPLNIGKANLASLALGITLWIWSKGERDRMLLDCNLYFRQILAISCIAAMVIRPLLIIPFLWFGVGDDTRELPIISSLIFFTIYPVAGSQTGPALLLVVPIAFYIAVELAEPSKTINVKKPPVLPQSLAKNSSVIVYILAASMLVSFKIRETIRAKQVYERNSQLELRGANMIRIPSDQASHLKAVSTWIDKNCILFYGLPGLNSFYIFTDKKLPGRQSGTGWMKLLNEREQQAVITSMESVGPTERCLIVDENIANMWNQGRQMPSGPLVHYLQSRFVYVNKIGGVKLFKGDTK